jgi:hypothetical protein
LTLCRVNPPPFPGLFLVRVPKFPAGRLETVLCCPRKRGKSKLSELQNVTRHKFRDHPWDFFLGGGYTVVIKISQGLFSKELKCWFLCFVSEIFFEGEKSKTSYLMVPQESVKKDSESKFFERLIHLHAIIIQY